MASNTYMAGERRKVAILQAGMEIWGAEGAESVTARAIGQRLGMTHSGVLYHFRSSSALKQAVASFAVRVGHAPVIRQLITVNHPAVADMGDKARKAWLLKQ